MRPSSLSRVLLVLLALATGPLAAAPNAMTAAPATAVTPPPRLTLAELRERYRSPLDRQLDIEGIEVYYRDQGRGPAILLIHGSNSTMRAYDELAQRLQRRYRVVRYDVPPNGLSGAVPDAVLGRLRPTDIPARLLAHLGIRSATAVGVSSGGTMALFLAADHPALVDRVVVSCAPADPVDLSKLKKSPELLEAEQRWGDYMDTSRTKPESFWRTYADFYSAVPGRFPAHIVREMYDFGRRVAEPNPTAMAAVVADQARAIAAMNAVRVPVLLLWGAADPLLPPAAAHALARHLGNASLSMLMVPDASHYPPYEIPDRYAAILENYLEQVAPVARAGTGR